MAVLLEGACPPHREVLKLGRQCSLVYGLLWESAFKDVRLDARYPFNKKLACGGCTSWTVKGISRECRLGKSSVIEALKALLDAGYIQYAGVIDEGAGPRRRWRVTHPDQLETVRHAISVMGLPSERYNDSLTTTTDDTSESQEGETWSPDQDGSLWSQNDEAGGGNEVEVEAELAFRGGEGEDGCDVALRAVRGNGARDQAQAWYEPASVA